MLLAPIVAAPWRRIHLSSAVPTTSPTTGRPLTPPDTASTAGPQLSRGKRFLFGSILILIMLVVLEVAAGFYLRLVQGYDGRQLMQYSFDPYKNILPTPNFRDIRGVTHNAAGFRRTTEVERVKPEGTLRVFLMGASTAFGTGGLWTHIDPNYPVLDDSETIDAYLETILQAAFPDRRVEVINAAIPSIWVHHHLIYLNQSILRYEPDLVLFLDGFNDHFFFGPHHDQFSRYAYGEHSAVIMGPPTLGALASMNGWWLFRKSALAHALMRTARTVRTMVSPRPVQRPIEVQSALAQVGHNFDANALAMMERSALILQHEGIPSLFMLQPQLIMERDRPGMPEIEQRLFDFNVESNFPNYEAFMRQAVPLVARRSQEALTALGADYMDLTRLYWERPISGQVFTDYAHLTPEANLRLAEEVAARIIPVLAGSSSDPADAAAPNGTTPASP